MSEARGAGPGRRVPWVSVLTLALLVAGYSDMKSDVMALKGRVEAMAATGAHPPDDYANDDVLPLINRHVPPPVPDVAPPADAPAAPPTSPVAAPTGGQPPARCEGTLGSEQVRAALGRHARDVFACYAERVAQVPTLAGPLRLTLWIDARGAVSYGRIDGLDDPGLRGCVRAALTSWHFDAPTGGDCAIVEAPFALSPDAP